MFLFLSAPSVLAQVDIYVKGGFLANSSNSRLFVSNKLQTKDNAKISYTFHAGVILEIPLSSNFLFIPEAQVIQKSVASSPISLLKDTDFYLETNAMFSYAPLSWFSVQLGPGVGTHLYSYNGQNEIRLLDFSGNVGFAFKISSRVQLITRASHSVFSIIDPAIFFDPQITGEDFKYYVYNRNVQLSIAYKIKQK
jgi:hypothetical protein